MKKWKTGAALVLMVAALAGGTTAYAAGYGGGHPWNCRDSSAVPAVACPWGNDCWRDSDRDGTRDACTGGGPCADADGDGICALCGWTVPDYVDADGDGICDHYGTGHFCGGSHGGRHCRR